jgi:hypothetical protein
LTPSPIDQVFIALEQHRAAAVKWVAEDDSRDASLSMMMNSALQGEAPRAVVEEEEDSPVAAEEALAIPLCRRTDSNLRTRLPSKSEVCRTR